MYRRKLTLNPDQISGDPLEAFPAQIQIAHPDLKSSANGGHVSNDLGEDIRFTETGGDPIPFQIVTYDPLSGTLSAQVKIRQVDPSENTVIYLDYGGQAVQSPPWTDDVEAFWAISATSEPAFPSDRKEDFDTDQLTVEAWVTNDRLEPETIQSIISQWEILDTFDTFSGFDAGNTDGLDSRAYFGSVFDGRYIYFAPEHYEEHESHGIVLRYDTHRPFKEPESYSAYDAGKTDGLRTEGYYGAVFDGRYVYFVPRQDTQDYHSRVLRYDTHGGFKDTDSWSAYDVGEPHSHQGVAFDGRYIYFAPGYSGNPREETSHTGRVIRCDTRSDFKDKNTWSVFDANEITELNATCFDGAGFDGRYIYFAPLLHGIALQYDTRGDFHDPASWSVFDGQEKGLSMCVGTVFDGRHIYFVPYSHPTVVRFDITKQFEDDSAWSSFNAEQTSGLNTSGFDGGFFDGKYVYFIPFVGPPMGARDDGSQGYTFHCNFLRYDPSQPFDRSASWGAFDSGIVDGLHTVGYNGGAYDGRYFYLAPWRDGTGEGGMHGRILRYDTTGPKAAFDLRFSDCGQNGGLCAALLGPTFLVNTENGPLSVAARTPLTAGRHHLVGVYNGRALKLFVNGSLVAERTGTGKIKLDRSAISHPSDPNGYGSFRGTIESASVRTDALGDNAIKSTYRNGRNTAEAVHVGKEEGI